MTKDIERLKEIIKIAYALKWTTSTNVSYPLMQLSEVEKCMLAMVDDSELEWLRGALKEVESGRLDPKADTAVSDLVSYASAANTSVANPPNESLTDSTNYKEK